MAQGFKPTKAGPPKAKPKSGKAQPKGPKRGPKVIAPRKNAAVKHANNVRVSSLLSPFSDPRDVETDTLCMVQKQTASLTKQIETEMAGRASTGGPLTIMKSAADGAAADKAAKEKKQKGKR